MTQKNVKEKLINGIDIFPNQAYRAKWGYACSKS